jgi:hypothetical protein
VPLRSASDTRSSVSSSGRVMALLIYRHGVHRLWLEIRNGAVRTEQLSR